MSEEVYIMYLEEIMGSGYPPDVYHVPTEAVWVRTK